MHLQQLAVMDLNLLMSPGGNPLYYHQILSSDYQIVFSWNTHPNSVLFPSFSCSQSYQKAKITFDNTDKLMFKSLQPDLSAEGGDQNW